MKFIRYRTKKGRFTKRKTSIREVWNIVKGKPRLLGRTFKGKSVKIVKVPLVRKLPVRKVPVKKPIVKKKPPVITTETEIKFRTLKGKFTERKTGLREEYEVIKKDGKEISRTLIVDSFKDSTTVNIDREEGSIATAFDKSNIYTRLEGVKQVNVEIIARDSKEKRKRFSFAIDFTTKAFLSDRLTGEIVARLHETGYRMNYPLKIVDWRQTKVSRGFVARKERLHDVILKVELIRR